MNYKCLTLILFAGTLLSTNAFPENPDISGNLLVFHAGSLAVPFREIVEAFNKEYPDVNVLREAAGSRECARKIADLDRNCDVMASADYAVIDNLLIPKHANWNIKFATNEMAIAYTKESQGAKEITPENWHRLLLRDDIRFGRSEPNADPCGYRTVLTLKLAAQFYQVPGLVESFLQKDLRYMRPKETDLLALLETQTIDYMFIYRSVAEQHDLQWLALPDEINLKQPDLADHYASVSVELSGTTPGATIERRGEPMVYGVTIPNNAPNPKAAEAFVAFLLNKEKGQAIMKKNGQPSVVPTTSSTFDNIPPSLKPFALEP